MQKSKFFFNPLRSRLLQIFVAAHILFAIFLGEIFAFAPDESGYLANFSKLYKLGFNSPGLIGWQQTPILYLRIMYAPASLFHLLGISGYLAIRLLSILAAATAIYLIMCVSRFASQGHDRARKYLIVILFIPSLFLWTTLGLRESFIFLSLSMICTGIFLLSLNMGRSSFALEFLGLWLLLNSKAYLFVLATLAILFQLSYQSIRQHKVLKMNAYILIAIALPLIMYPPGTKAVAQGIWVEAHQSVQSIAGPSPTPTLPSGGITLPGGTGKGTGPIGKSGAGGSYSKNNGAPVTPIVVQDPGVTLSALAEELRRHPNTLFSKMLKETGISPYIESSATPTTLATPTTPSSLPSPAISQSLSTTSIPSPSITPALEASPKPIVSVKPTPKLSTGKLPAKQVSPTPTMSAKPTQVATVVRVRHTSRMNVTKASLRNPISIIVRSGGFLLTPFPFIDNGSFFLDISAFEAPFWWFVYVAFGIAIWRRFKRKQFDELAYFAMAFIGLFLAFSALTEVNVGTMIRHRSVLLIPVLFLIILPGRQTMQPLEKQLVKDLPPPKKSEPVSSTT